MAAQGSQEAEAGVQGQPGLNSETLSSQGGQTHWGFLLFPFFISFNEVGSLELLLKICFFKKSYCVITMAEGVTNKNMLSPRALTGNSSLPMPEN